MLRLWKIEPLNTEVASHLSWDSFRSFVVVAETQQAAREIHPRVGSFSFDKDGPLTSEDLWKETEFYEWVKHPSHTKISLLGNLDPDSGHKAGDVVITDYCQG